MNRYVSINRRTSIEKSHNNHMMTELEIETVVQALDDDRTPHIRLKQPNGGFRGYELSDEIVHEEIDGFSSFDSLIITQDDIEKLAEFLDDPYDLPAEMTVFAVPCRGYRVWGTTFNHRMGMDESEYKDWIKEKGHGITSERAPPNLQLNVESILDLSNS